ncbi:MAG: accessory gene regulator B family protein [bacterium]|nr:accessory gene regulator B family protein [bacterium]
MIQSISDKIVQHAIRNEYIKQEQRDEYVYALNMLLNILITDATMLCIGFLMGMIWECIIFWLIYKVLRKYCGGFHFGTSWKCYLSSCIMCPAVLAAIRYVPYDKAIWGVLTAAMAAALFILSPVAAENKPLDEKEKQVFGSIAKVLVIMIMICWCIATLILHNEALSKIISLSIFSVTAFVIAGKIHLTVLRHK